MPLYAYRTCHDCGHEVLLYLGPTMAEWATLEPGSAEDHECRDDALS